MSQQWLERRVVVTAGTGGVGKTTLAAAIALEAAASGHRTLVLTIDPARRLANALGLEALGHAPVRISDETLARVIAARDGAGAAPAAASTGSPGRAPGGGELHAMMLDTQRTFDELVERFAPDPDARRRILENRIYRSLTDALSGTREYSAMEKLHQLYSAREYEVIVVDTPPAAHALQFLEAPRRLVGFLDGGFLQAVLHPAAAIGRTSFRLFHFGSSMALKALERITGFGFFSDLSEFFLAFEGLLGGFQERAREVGRLLRSDACGFVLVAGPEPEQIRRSLGFAKQLRADRVPLVGLVVNRVVDWPGPGAAPDPDAPDWQRARAWLEERCGPEGTRLLAETLRRHAIRARRDAAMSEQLEKALPLPEAQMHRLPLLAAEIHSPEGLGRLCAALFP